MSNTFYNNSIFNRLEKNELYRTLHTILSIMLLYTNYCNQLHYIILPRINNYKNEFYRSGHFFHFYKKISYMNSHTPKSLQKVLNVLENHYKYRVMILGIYFIIYSSFLVIFLYDYKLAISILIYEFTFGKKYHSENIPDIIYGALSLKELKKKKRESPKETFPVPENLSEDAKILYRKLCTIFRTRKFEMEMGRNLLENNIRGLEWNIATYIRSKLGDQNYDRHRQSSNFLTLVINYVTIHEINMDMMNIPLTLFLMGIYSPDITFLSSIFEGKEYKFEHIRILLETQDILLIEIKATRQMDDSIIDNLLFGES